MYYGEMVEKGKGIIEKGCGPFQLFGFFVLYKFFQ